MAGDKKLPNKKNLKDGSKYNNHENYFTILSLS
jgi:hypothetical protein